MDGKTAQVVVLDKITWEKPCRRKDDLDIFVTGAHRSVITELRPRIPKEAQNLVRMYALPLCCV